MRTRTITAGLHSRNGTCFALIAVTGRPFTLKQLNNLDREVRSWTKGKLHWSMAEYSTVGQQSQGLGIRAFGPIDRADFEATIQKLFVPITVQLSWINAATDTKQPTVRRLYKTIFTD